MAKPKIRFNGYTEDWEQRKLGDIATFINGRAYSQEELLSSGKYKVLRVGNFYTNDSWYYSDMELEDKYYAEEGDLLYTWSATFGPHIWHGDKIIYHYHIWKVELSDTLEKHFAVQLLEKDKQSILSDKNGSTMVHITKAGMESKEVMLPPNIREQAEIGKYLQNIDHLITLHQRKCEQTKTLKKYMLQKMFPQDGEKVPQIRFEGFTEDWEQRKFGELYEKVNEKNDLSFGADKIISVANMYFKEEVKESNDDYMRTYNVMRLGDIAFEGNKSKNFSHGRFVENTIGDGIVSHVFDVFRPVMNYDLLFWKYLINNENVMGRIMTRCTKASTMMTNLVAKDFLNEDILIPTIEEQSKIGECIDKIDYLITLHQRKCDELKEVKKFMLQNMFV